MADFQAFGSEWGSFELQLVWTFCEGSFSNARLGDPRPIRPLPDEIWSRASKMRIRDDSHPGTLVNIHEPESKYS